MAVPIGLLLSAVLAAPASAGLCHGAACGQNVTPQAFCATHPNAPQCQNQNNNSNNNQTLQGICVTNPAICQGFLNSNSPGGPSGGGDAQQQQLQQQKAAASNGARSMGSNPNWDPSDLNKLNNQEGGASGAAPAGGPGASQASYAAAQQAGRSGAPQEDFTSKQVADLSGGSYAGKSAASAGPDAYGDVVRSAGTKFRLGDFNGALNDALQACALDPNNAEGYLKAAEAYNKLGKYAEAEAMAREALKRDPNNAYAWKNLAWALLKEGKYKEALEAALMAIKLKPDMAEAWAIAAYAAERLGDKANRLAYLQHAAELDGRYKAKLENVRNGGNAYDDDVALDDSSGRKRGAGVPWAPIGGGVAGLGAVAAAAYFIARRRAGASSVVAAAPTLVDAKPAAPVSLGKYQLGIVIGRGGMGQVFLGNDTTLGRQVAIKKMTKTLSDLGPDARAAFIKEARTVAQLHHPAIVDVYDIVDSGDDVFVVFELVRGKTVQQLLAEAGKLPLKEAARILTPVCEALSYAHGHSFIHRDLKPSNIMVAQEGHVKLMDFGIARSLADVGARQVTGVTPSAGVFARTMHAIGTPAYMPPEAEQGVICAQGDVFALGVTLYEMVTGQIPFGSLATALEKASQRVPPPSTIVPALPKAVDDLVAASLQPDPTKRLASAAEFGSRLQAAAS